MTIEEFKKQWIEAGWNIEDLIFNHYKVSQENGYVNGYYAVVDDDYDFYGQMALYNDVCEGWTKFVKDESECGGYFVVDEAKKAEIEEERAREAAKPTDQDRLEAQALFTALMTDTLLPEEDE